MEVVCLPNNTKTPINPVSGNRYHKKECARNSSNVKPKGQRDVEQLSLFNYVPANAHSSQGEPRLYTFEDNEAVIQDDNQRKMSDSETCAKNPQSCS